MSDIAVRVEHLSKMYRLGVINNGTLYKDIQTWFALKRGKEDPHSKIGEDKYSGDNDHFWALKDISFDIKQGDRIGIIGKNGAGKSTLLKILSRITAPTEGTVKIKGKIASLLEVGTGFHNELTGRENIYLNGAILGMKKRRIDEKLDSIIEFSGIEHHIDTPVKRYSSGMFVRLAFAVAAHLDSDILIADEVLAVGDAEFQKKALGKMEDLSTGEGRTVLFVSHNMGAVKSLCKTGIILENGSLGYNSNNITDVISVYLNDANNTYYDSIADRTDRQGNGIIMIEDIKLCDKKTNSYLSNGEQLKFSIIFNNKKNTVNPRLLLSINTFDNQCVLFLDSETNEGKFALTQKGELCIQLSNEFALSPDRYFVNVACYENGILADYIQKAFIFTITDYSFCASGHLPAGKGICMVKQEWSFNELQ